MKKRLSTPLTFFFKFVFSTIWFFACRVLLFGDGFGKTFDPTIIILLVVLPFFVFWEYSRIKKVEMDMDYLYVSNYIRREKIPLDNVGSITDNIWLQSHPVTINLKESCSFGRKVVFMPRMMFLFFQHHPIVNELKNMVATKEFKKNL